MFINPLRPERFLSVVPKGVWGLPPQEVDHFLPRVGRPYGGRRLGSIEPVGPRRDPSANATEKTLPNLGSTGPVDILQNRERRVAPQLASPFDVLTRSEIVR